MESNKLAQQYGGLSKREIEMRKKMALRFGRQASHLNPPQPD
jgi:hypothetical protein